MRIPILTTPRLMLRGFEAGDWDAFAEMNAEPAVRRWLGGAVCSREQAWSQMETILGQWALRGYGVFAVEVGGRFAGRVGILHPADWTEPELAWTIAAPFRGSGIATEAAARVRDWAFATPRAGTGWSATSCRRTSARGGWRKGWVRCARGGSCCAGSSSDVWVHPRPGSGVVV